VNVISVFKTGETDVGDMVVAVITEPLVANVFEWLTVAPLMTTVGLKVVERSDSLNGSVKQTSSVDVDITGMQFVF
jgi:hypothetical protein